MAQRESFDAFLKALRLSWMRVSEASAVRQRAACESRALAAGMPRQLVIRPPRSQGGAQPAPFLVDTADLFQRAWMRPAALSLSFDCELRPAGGGRWLLHIVQGGRRRGWWARPCHRVDIVLDGEGRAGGEVLFDGQTLRRFGAVEAQERP